MDITRIIVETQNAYIPVKISEIIMAESDFKTCVIYTAAGARHPLGMSLKKLEEILGTKEFIRASRQWLVRLDMIDYIEKSFLSKSCLVLKDSAGPGRIEVSNDRLKAILEALEA